METAQIREAVARATEKGRMPMLFIGHGHPKNAIEANDFTEMLQELSPLLAKPKGVVVVSAHWLTHGTYLLTNPTPQAMHDFGPFDIRLFTEKYSPVPFPKGEEPWKANPFLQTLPQEPERDLDHGVWTVLKFLFPKADVPVTQISLDRSLGFREQFLWANQLFHLREEGYLIIGSGNIVHNLYEVAWDQPDAVPAGFAISFSQWVKRQLKDKELMHLVEPPKDIFSIAHPTPEHYMPLLYVVGNQGPEEETIFLYDGFQYGCISMLSFMIA